MELNGESSNAAVWTATEPPIDWPRIADCCSEKVYFAAASSMHFKTISASSMP